MTIDILIDSDRSRECRRIGRLSGLQEGFRYGQYGIYMQEKESGAAAGRCSGRRRWEKEGERNRLRRYYRYIIERYLFLHKAPLPGSSVWMPESFCNPAIMQGKTGDRLSGKIE